MSTAACPGCEGEQTHTFVVQGMCCATEAALIEERLRDMPGICAVQASGVTGRATVVHTVATGEVQRAIASAGFVARPDEAARPSLQGTWPTATAAVLGLAGFLAGFFSSAAAVAFYAPAIALGGWRIARTGLQRARQGAFDMNVLMTIAVMGAMAIGEWGEGAATVVLFSLAQVLEQRSLERARRAITGLMELAPDTARVLRAEGEVRVPAGSVARGERIVVWPGERVPLDGTVVAGLSEVDQSPLTGESRPVTKGPADGVFAGSINGPGALEVDVTRQAAETTLARVLRRVEEAQASKARTQGFVDAFARVYTPAVVALAALLVVVPPLLGLGAFADWSYRALVLLVIACPCALVISTPVSIVSALTAASRAGVLIKGGVHLEEMGRVRAVIFDKTGTLTTGAPRVIEVVPAEGVPPRELLALAAAVEARSGHPIGEAILARAQEGGAHVPPAEDVVVVPGRGACGVVGGRMVVVGSHRLFDERAACDHRLDPVLERIEADGRTAVLVGYGGPGGAVLGVIGVGDALRPEAAAAVASLAAQGIAAAMLTGDNPRTAAAIAQRAGITEWQADLLPEDKVARVRAFRGRHGVVAMVGDGVNDAPALATANVGIAMGRRGTDVALETADVVLMGDDLRRIAFAVRLGHATRRTVRVNVAASLAVKAAVLAVAVAGYGSLWSAVAADMGASLLVIMNGLRLLGPAFAPAGDTPSPPP